MIGKRRMSNVLACLSLLALAAPAAVSQSEIPAGTRFMVELRDKLKAKKAKPGKGFKARTLEALRAADGGVVPAGAEMKGRVSWARSDEMILRFEEIRIGGKWMPIVATVKQVGGEKDVKRKTGKEGEIEADGGRGKGAAIGAVILGGSGAAIGAAKGGGKGAAIGGASGAAAGALIGAAASGRDLVLHKGTRLELELDRPLIR